MTDTRRHSSINLRQADESASLDWEDIRGDVAWQGRWVALDECAYNEAGETTAGVVVDYDDNLAELCARLSAERRKRCSVVFCRRAESAA
jgi:hypothetical protein